ncbi:unnamed protein product [Withania somnifera]
MTTSFGTAVNIAAVDDPNPNTKLQIYTFNGLKSTSNSLLLSKRLPVRRSFSPSNPSSIVRAVSTSNFIRYPLKEEILNDAPNINEAATQLIKFHGSYMQYNRDECGTRSYSFMLRTKNPGGEVPNRLYLVMDDLADQFGIGTLRLTTRQTFQLHGLPHLQKDYMFAKQTADDIAALLTPQSGFYYNVWVDGEKFLTEEPPEVVKARNDNTNGTNFPDSPEPIYGTQFLPRKFKIAVTVPIDNSVDIFTNDIGVVVVSDEDGEPQGFNIYVGGGMGRTHRMETTFPRLAEPLGYVRKEDILYAVKAIVVTRRENGRRDDCRYSRLKYLLSSWGIEKFRSVTEQYYGKKFEPCRELPEWEFKSYLGWHEQGDGNLFCGLHVDNGRVKGEMNKALREVIEKYNLNVRLTPNQNIILCNVRQGWRRPINIALAQGGLLLFHFCPLAITEAERGIPDILKRVRAIFEKIGMMYHESVVIRVTGCPNGCVRPYMAELGLVGDGPNSYQIWLGGTSNQTSLAKTFKDKVKVQDLEKGFEKLGEVIEKWEGIPASSSRFTLKLFADKETYEAMDALGRIQNKIAHQLAIEVVRNYVASHLNGKSMD